MENLELETIKNLRRQIDLDIYAPKNDQQVKVLYEAYLLLGTLEDKYAH